MPATIRDIAPNNGVVGGGTQVTITGTGFVNGCTVRFGRTQVEDVRFLSDTSLTCTTPLGPPPQNGGLRPPVDVSVTNRDEATVTARGLFTYRNSAVVTSISPNEGPTTAGRQVIITGTGFIDGARAYIGDQEVTQLEFINNTTLRGHAPANNAGTYSVLVINRGEPAEPALVNAYTCTTNPTETDGNSATFINDGEDFFEQLRLMFESVIAVNPANNNTYIRLAYWMIDREVLLGNRLQRVLANRTLLEYIDRTIRAGHRVDVIMWRPATYERVGLGAEAAGPNEDFAKRVYAIDQAAAATPGANRARVYLEHYEGEIGSSNHQKIAIASVNGQRTALIGGLNLLPCYYSLEDHSDSKWHDTALCITGPATDDIEAEWTRRWLRTDQIAQNWVSNTIGVGGWVLANNFGFNNSVEERQASVALHRNTTLQNRSPNNVPLSIALTRSVGEVRYRALRDKLIELINGANNFIYLENYHLCDPDIIRAIYTRQAQRIAAGAALRVVAMVPAGGGSDPSSYMTRRAWLQIALRLPSPGPAPANVLNCTSVTYEDSNGNQQTVAKAGCALWNVVDSYNPDQPIATNWLNNDALVFRLNTPLSPIVTVRFDKIVRVKTSLHFFTPVAHYGPDWQNIYTHSKLAVIDNQHLVCGSANFSFRSMQYDGEISGFVRHGGIAAAALTRLLNHYNDSHAPAPPVSINNIEDQSLINIFALLDHANAHPSVVARVGQLNRRVIVPLEHDVLPGVLMARTMPPDSIVESLWNKSAPNYTWI
ncbi:MAG: IPT/TIG domain-containing protein [Gammaproteobacteria bacterium]|nr:IPT/TIG domain-containing protein [Gammaproteobacteria bacterium]